MRKGPVIKASDTIRREYQAALEAYIKKMNTELMREITSAYAGLSTGFPPQEVAGDASAAAWLKSLLAAFFSRWREKFDDMGDKRAKWFAGRTEKASTEQIQKMLKDIGFTVEFKNSAHVNAELEKIYMDNARLIRNIPDEARGKIEKIIRDGVERGNDRQYIAEELPKVFKMTEGRAKFIARDQCQKANAALSMARSAELGYEGGYWIHRSISKIPRPTHISKEMNGQWFKLSEGLYDPDKRVKRPVKPGELPGCNCTFQLDLKSFRPQMARESVSIRPRETTHADIIDRLANPAGRGA
jgi:uncharacterized protein with gpF-like domain